ncbi:MAG: translocation/assembly module TamB domain-containing protein [Alphaproteobacteria bacterium]
MSAVKTVLSKTIFGSKKSFEWVGHFIIWSFAALLVVLVLIQAAFWGGVIWLNSSYGQKTVQSTLGQSLEGTPMRVILGGFNYIVPNRIGIGKVTIYQGVNKYVEINGLHLNADFLPLSRRELTVSLHADDVIIYEAKATPKTAENTSLPFPIIIPPSQKPELPFDRIFIDSLHVKSLVLKGATDTTFSPEINGRIDLFDGSLIALDLRYNDDGSQTPPAFPKKVKIKGQYDLAKTTAQIRSLSVESTLYAFSGKASAAFQNEGDLSFEILAEAEDVKDLDIIAVEFTAKNTADFIANLNINSTYQGNKIAVKTAAKSDSDNVILNPISVELPAISMGGNIALNTKNSIATGKVSGTLSSLDPYRSLIGNDHALSPVQFTLSMSGQEGAQNVAFNASTPEYKNIPSGLVFYDLKVAGSVLNQMLNIKSITARDREKGTFKASGSLMIDTMAVEASVSARALHAVQGDIASATLSMDMNVKGQGQEYAINGAIKPDEITIKLPERFAASIPELNIVNKDKGKQTERITADILSGISLDVLIDAPSKIFVRGWGLDSEFGGSVKVKGFADDPKFDGTFSVIRGRYSEFGRNFKLARGKLIFAGSVPPSPKLDIMTETKTGDILARIEITGSPEAPKIGFSSDPTLPEDEVLSHILFGKNMESISPFQAVKLTQTLQRFSGNGGGGGFSSFDPLDTVRSATGLDDLRVEADEEGGATVGAGKYLSDNVYLEFEAGSEEGSGNANIEIELTPNITIESEIGQDAQGGAGIFWKHDY